MIYSLFEARKKFIFTVLRLLNWANQKLKIGINDQYRHWSDCCVRHFWSTRNLLKAHSIETNTIHWAIYSHWEERSLGHHIHFLSSVSAIHSIGTNVIYHYPIHGQGLACFPSGCDLIKSANVEACLVLVRLVDLLSDGLSLLANALLVCLQGSRSFHLKSLICVLGIIHRFTLLFARRSLMLLLLTTVFHHGCSVAEELFFDWRHTGYAAVMTSDWLWSVAISAGYLRRQYCLVHRAFGTSH